MRNPNSSRTVTRREALKDLGVLSGALAAGSAAPTLGAGPAKRTARSDKPAAGYASTPNVAGSIKAITELVFRTSLVDTHEHLLEEKDRLRGAPHPFVPCDDWAMLFSHYLNSDFLSAGMTREDLHRFLSTEVKPEAKWTLIEPYWPAVRHTGYAQAVRIAIRELYGVEELSGSTVRKVQAGYEKTRKPGFYGRVLGELGGLESCQVNSLGEPFRESDQPLLLMQDLSIVGMFAGPALDTFGKPTGITVNGLADWHRVIDWWFERYAQYAVAVKSQHAYSRDIDYRRVPAETAEPVFARTLQKDPINNDDQKLLEDHLFWYAVDKATAYNLPVKLHTGYYAGANSMPLGRLQRNPASASDLCRQGPDTQFVFMHIGYPYYEEMAALAKQWSNATIDMCWAWIINPTASKDYLKKHLVTAPANKLLPFGGDYLPVEPVLGHAIIARRGIALALSELVNDGWISLEESLDLVPLILHGNARRLFNLERKTAALREAPWN